MTDAPQNAMGTREEIRTYTCADPQRKKEACPFLQTRASHSVPRVSLVRVSAMSYSSSGSGYAGGGGGRGRDGRRDDDLLDKIKSVNWRGLGRNISNKVKQYAMNLSPLEIQTEEGTLGGSVAAFTIPPYQLDVFFDDSDESRHLGPARVGHG
jgi:hypothetical protein